MVSYLEQKQVLAASPETAGHLLSFYWGGALAGRVVGSFVLRRVKGGAALAVCALAAGGLATLSALTGGTVSGWSLLAVGLANSIMFPTIFAMAIEGLGPRTAQGAGIVCVAIVGGAVVPVVTGALADRFGLQVALAAPILCYACVAAYGLAALRSLAAPERPRRRERAQPSTNCRIRKCAMAMGGGERMPSGWVPASMADTASRSNQRASSISVGSVTISPSSASATQPSISEEGNGQGCEVR